MVRGSLRARHRRPCAPNWTPDDLPIPQSVIAELNDEFPDFAMLTGRMGWRSGFADFEPAQLFRNAFLKGWYFWTRWCHRGDGATEEYGWRYE